MSNEIDKLILQNINFKQFTNLIRYRYYNIDFIGIYTDERYLYTRLVNDIEKADFINIVNNGYKENHNYDYMLEHGDNGILNVEYNENPDYDDNDKPIILFKDENRFFINIIKERFLDFLQRKLAEEQQSEIDRIRNINQRTALYENTMTFFLDRGYLRSCERRLDKLVNIKGLPYKYYSWCNEGVDFIILNVYDFNYLFKQYNKEIKQDKTNCYLSLNTSKFFIEDNDVKMYIFPLVVSVANAKLNIAISCLLGKLIYGNVYFFTNEKIRDRTFNKLYS